VRTVEKEDLPEDAQFKGYVCRVGAGHCVSHRHYQVPASEKYYSKSEKRTYLASLLAGYSGQFGPNVKAWVLTLYYADGMSEPKILDLLHTIGMSMSAGQLSNLLIKDIEQFSTDFWALYRDLLAYRDHPGAAQADALRASFDFLFGQPSGYQQLDACKARTLAKEEPEPSSSVVSIHRSTSPARTPPCWLFIPAL
jgi:hypothetical protein